MAAMGQGYARPALRDFSAGPGMPAPTCRLERAPTLIPCTTSIGPVQIVLAVPHTELVRRESVGIHADVDRTPSPRCNSTPIGANLRPNLSNGLKPLPNRKSYESPRRGAPRSPGRHRRHDRPHEHRLDRHHARLEPVDTPACPNPSWSRNIAAASTATQTACQSRWTSGACRPASCRRPGI